MSEKFILKGLSRDNKKEKPSQIRAEGFIPAVIYGSNKESRALKVKANEFIKLFHGAGETNLIELTIDQDNAIKVLVYETQTDPIKNRINHIDFLQVDMKKKITVEVPVDFVGESPAVRDQGASLIKNLDHIEIECLPEDLIHTVEIDISSLKEIDAAIKLSDLKLPKGVELTTDNLDEHIVSVIRQEVEVEAAPAAEAAEAPAPEVKKAE